jgi:uncharacterized protein (DUF2249 family)
MNNTTVKLDVRDDIRNGREPFSKIMDAASNLREGQSLLLLAPFEPVPLVHILNQRGFRHSAHSNRAGDWEVLFERRSMDAPAETVPTSNPRPISQASPDATQLIEVDVRGLEPPLPMIKILEALAILPLDADLLARTDRRPIHLYPQLEDRGFAARTEEQPDGSFLTHICHS